MRQRVSRRVLEALILGAMLIVTACGDDGGAGADAASDASGADTAQVDTAPEVDPQCVGASFNQPCDDGNPCTDGDTCIEERCRGALIACDDDNPCTDDSCDPLAGCVHLDNDATCSDGDPCTIQDRCQAGACVGAPADRLACDDGDPCTVDDQCTAGVCGGTLNACDDLNPCTRDLCDPDHEDAEHGTGCVHEPREGICNDSNACTVGDRCVDGACVGTVEPDRPCNDGDLCTEDERCQSDGTCGGGVPIDCSDGDDCTLDTCNPAFGCRNPPDEGHECDDGLRCTTDDVCDDDGVCVGVEIECQPDDLCKIGTCDEQSGACVVVDADCDDGNSCTDDSCDPATGCAHINNHSGCDDGSLCTSNDHCEGGRCVGDAVTCDTSGDTLCRANTCDPDTGECRWEQFDGTLCNDQEPCTHSDVCSGGECVGIVITCTDGDPCTEDYCDGEGVCQHDPLSPEECGDLALDRANEYRALIELPKLVNHESIILAAENHCAYYVNNPEPYDNGLSPHDEQDGYEGFTGVGHGERMVHAGYTGQPTFEVMAFINDPVRSVDEWMATLYHRIPFVLPSTLEMGYGASEVGARACDTIDFGGNPDGDPDWNELIVPFPPDGMAGVPTTWDGAESPQPPLPNPYPSGPILTLTFAQQSGFPDITLTDSDIHSSDGPVPHVANDHRTDDHLGSGGQSLGVIALYPNSPLATFTTYTVVVSYTYRDSAGSDSPGTTQWSFTTGNGASSYFLP